MSLSLSLSTPFLLISGCLYPINKDNKKIKKKDNIVSCATKWMELELIMLSEISKEVKDKYWRASLICGIYRIETHKLAKKKSETNTVSKTL